MKFEIIYLILEQTLQMRIVTYKRIAEFIEKHNDSKIALQEWFYKTSKANWDNASEIKNTFSNVDFIGNTGQFSILGGINTGWWQ